MLATVYRRSNKVTISYELYRVRIDAIGLPNLVFNQLLANLFLYDFVVMGGYFERWKTGGSLQLYCKVVRCLIPSPDNLDGVQS